MVIAETAAQAKDAADSVEVDYEPLPASTDTRKGEVAFDIDLGAKAPTEAAMPRRRMSRGGLVNNRLVANPIEPRAALAEYDAASGRTTLYTPSRDRITCMGRLPTRFSRPGAKSCASYPATSAARSA